MLTASELLLEASDRERYASDQSGLIGDLPVAVIRPQSADTLSRAVAICADTNIAMVPQGGRTGLSGGACSIDGSVVISTELMNGIIEVDADTMTLSAWAGTPLQVVQQVARDHGLFYPVDIGARGTATLGGTIATNAGGIRVLRYGMTRQHIVGLEAVLPSGRIVSRMGKLIKDNAGLDLKHLFIGSEGALGIVTRAVVQLRTVATGSMTAILGLNSHAAALACLASARKHFPDALLAFEGMWPDYWKFVCHDAALAMAPFDSLHGFYVLLEIATHDDAAEVFEAWLGQLFNDKLVENGVIAKSLAETRTLWNIREAVGDIDAKFGHHINFDLGISPSLLGKFCDDADMLLGSLSGVTGTLKVGHIGDGNVHYLVSHLDDDHSIRAVEEAIYGQVKEFGGTVTAEHGVGRIKRHWLSYCRSESELLLMKQLKLMLDPNGLMNPGVLFE